MVQLLLVLWALSSQHFVHGARKCDRPKLFANYKIVDLSHHFNNRTIYWADDAHFRLNVTVVNATEAGWLQADEMAEAIHGGTHLDAPRHFGKGCWDAAEIPLERLMFLPVALVDVRDRVATNPEYLLSVSDVLNWEEQYGRLPDGCLFLACTGQSKYWPDHTAYLGIDENGTRHFPSISPEAGTFFVEKRRVFGVGVDSLAIDKSGDTTVHRTILSANIFAIENLNALHQVPPKGAYAIVLPLKIDGASGSPVRVVALVP
ncbi:isatin hydrolase-like [Amblyomma americanum]